MEPRVPARRSADASCCDAGRGDFRRGKHGRVDSDRAVDHALRIELGPAALSGRTGESLGKGPVLEEPYGGPGKSGRIGRRYQEAGLLGGDDLADTAGVGRHDGDARQCGLDQRETVRLGERRRARTRRAPRGTPACRPRARPTGSPRRPRAPLPAHAARSRAGRYRRAAGSRPVPARRISGRAATR